MTSDHVRAWVRIANVVSVALLAVWTFLALAHGETLLAWIAGIACGLWAARLLIAVHHWKAQR